MNREHLARQLRKIISKVAGIAMSELADEQMLREELMLDSLKEMEIVARTEVEFGIDLEEERLDSIQTLKEYCDFVAEALDSARTQGGRGRPLQGGV